MGDKKKAKQSKFQQWWDKNRMFIVSLAVLIVAISSSPWWLRYFSATPESEQPIVELYSKSTSRSLRALEPLETGKQIMELPHGVYFFVDPIFASYGVKNPEAYFFQATNRRRDNYFEVQKTENNYYLIGFISDEAYANIASVDRDNSMYTILFSNQWRDVKHPIAIPFDAINTIRSRRLDIDKQTQIQVLDVDFIEVKDNPEVHT